MGQYLCPRDGNGWIRLVGGRLVAGGGWLLVEVWRPPRVTASALLQVLQEPLRMVLADHRCARSEGRPSHARNQLQEVWCSEVLGEDRWSQGILYM